jgi:hypothetical protein
MPRRARLSLPGIPWHTIQRFQAGIEAALGRRAMRGAPGRPRQPASWADRKTWCVPYMFQSGMTSFFVPPFPKVNGHGFVRRFSAANSRVPTDLWNRSA